MSSSWPKGSILSPTSCLWDFHQSTLSKIKLTVWKKGLKGRVSYCTMKRFGRICFSFFVFFNTRYYQFDGQSCGQSTGLSEWRLHKYDAGYCNMRACTRWLWGTPCFMTRIFNALQPATHNSLSHVISVPLLKSHTFLKSVNFYYSLYGCAPLYPQNCVFGLG